MKLIHPKTLWRRFRAWQERPFHYKNHSQGTQHCANCGTTFNDNFCPRCGQAAGSGRVGWNTIRYGVMEMWNLESRSLLTTLWQLLLRPGHLIDDYLSGKRQTSYPPVKMLLMVAVGIDIIRNLLGIPPNGATSISEADVNSLLSLYNQWAEQNQGWSYLIQGVLLIFPTWLFFRNSPRHHHHTLPEGFFLQAFISSLMLLLDALGDFMDQWVGLLILVYIYFIYHRIFGFRLWGTLWRTALSLFFSIFTIFIIIVGIEVIYDCIRSAGIG